jgi:riboflavin kinase, archaea type
MRRSIGSDAEYPALFAKRPFLIVTGLGNFGKWTEPLSNFYEQKTGMYPGSLNLELTFEYSLPSDVIRLEAQEYGGSVSVCLVPCRIFNRPAFLLRTDPNEQGMGHHPRNIIEIATDVRVREHYQLKDGDWVEVEFPERPTPVPCTKNAPGG